MTSSVESSASHHRKTASQTHAGHNRAKSGGEGLLEAMRSNRALTQLFLRHNDVEAYGEVLGGGYANGASIDEASVLRSPNPWWNGLYVAVVRKCGAGTCPS